MSMQEPEPPMDEPETGLRVGERTYFTQQGTRTARIAREQQVKQFAKFLETKGRQSAPHIKRAVRTGAQFGATAGYYGAAAGYAGGRRVARHIQERRDPYTQYRKRNELITLQGQKVALLKLEMEVANLRREISRLRA